MGFLAGTARRNDPWLGGTLRLDNFNDSVERVATAFEDDPAFLAKSAYDVRVEMVLPGYIRAIVAGGEEATKIEWAHDSAWRFMPTAADEEIGYRLHPIDLAVNKVPTVAGRDEVTRVVRAARIPAHLASTTLREGMMRSTNSGKA